MEYFIILLIVVIVYLLYLLNQKKNKSINTATIINKREEKTKRVIIDELEDQFFALNKFNIIKYANPSALKRFGSNLIDKNISSETSHHINFIKFILFLVQLIYLLNQILLCYF